MNAINTPDIGKSSAAALDALTHKAANVIDQAQSIKQEAPKLADLAADALKAYTSKGAELAKDATALAREKASQYADGAAQRVRQDPLKAILMAAAAGAAVALVASYAHGKRKALK